MDHETDIDQFLYNLHFDVEAVRALDVEVAWEDAPLPFKVYLDTTRLPLSSPSASWFAPAHESPQVRPPVRQPGSKEKNTSISMDMSQVSQLLWFSYGIAQITQTYLPSQDNPYGVDLFQTLRRFVPSGGALYPSELYIYLNIDDETRGIYHYDAAHQRLSLLRKGCFASYLNQAVAGGNDFSRPFATLFVSTVFWKNYFKYHDFSYRLQGIDAGALAGQITTIAEQFGVKATVQFQFLDAALNHLLGLSEEKETIYAVIPLLQLSQELEQVPQWTNIQSVTATDLQEQLEPISYSYTIKSKSVGAYPNIIALNKAAMYAATHQIRTPASIAASAAAVEEARKQALSGRINLPSLPARNFNFAADCRRRYSPGTDFWFRPVSLEQLTVLLQESTRILKYNNDIGPNHGAVGQAEDVEWPHYRTVLGVCVHGVSGVKDGAYVYDEASHQLRLRQEGDQRARLQAGMSMENVNLFQTPVCFHILGEADHLKSSFGYRGHRIQHMEVGILLQKLLIIAASLGMNGHPLLDYDQKLCDDIYDSGAFNKTTLIQIPVGYARAPARLQAALYRL